LSLSFIILSYSTRRTQRSIRPDTETYAQGAERECAREHECTHIRLKYPHPSRRGRVHALCFKHTEGRHGGALALPCPASASFGRLFAQCTRARDGSRRHCSGDAMCAIGWVLAFACSGAGSHRSLVGLTRRRPPGPCCYLLAQPHAATEEGVRAS
jgi:hypothetical protein